MLSVSSLPGLIDVAPIKLDVSVSGGGFAPLIAGLLGPAVKTDGIAVPTGGTKLPVPMPLSPSADAPAEPPAILVVPGLVVPGPMVPSLVVPGPPSLSDPELIVPHVSPPSATPVAATLASPPPRFAPIIEPVDPPATPPTGDHALPPALTVESGDQSRAPSPVTRAALLTSAATTMPPATVAQPPAPPLALLAPVSAQSIVRPAASGRKLATTEPVSGDDVNAPSPTTATAEPSATMLIDAPVVPDATTPPPASVDAALILTEASVPIAATPTTARAPVDLSVRPTRPTGTIPGSAQPIGERTTDDWIPHGTRSTVVPLGVTATPDRQSPPSAASVAQQPDRTPDRIEGIPASGAQPEVVVELSRTSRPKLAVAPVIDMPVVTPVPPQPIAPLGATVPTNGAQVITPLLVETRPAAAPVGQAPAQPAVVIGSTPAAALTAPPGPARPDPLATTASREGDDSRPPMASPMQQSAAPIILPALQAFGAAIRRAMADERKPAPSTDDTILGLSAPATVATSATAQTVAASDTTLDTADHRWPQAMAAQIEKLRDAADSQSTRIRLLPDALGPVDVAVRRDGDQVHVHFTAAQAETRQLLTEAQPRLADAAEARGVKLGRTDVSGGEQHPADRQQQQQRAPTQTSQLSRPAPAPTRVAQADEPDTRLA